MASRRKKLFPARKPQRTYRPRLETLEERLAPVVSPLTLVNPSLWGETGVKASQRPSISADGQLVAFQSDADDLVPNDTNGLTDVFLYNRSTGTVSLVSVGLNGTAGGGYAPVISPDGRYVAFESNTRKILPSFANDNFLHLFMRDLQEGTTSLLSIAATSSDGGNRGAGDSLNPATSQVAFSADSRHVGFISRSSNLVTGITFTSPSLGIHNLFVRDITVGTTNLVSTSRTGATDGNAVTSHFSLSSDARFVAFESSASNLTNFDANGLEDVFIRDMRSGITRLVSVNAQGLASADGHNRLPDHGQTQQAISADGRYVIFHTNATNVVPGNLSGTKVFLRDTVAGTTRIVSQGASGHNPGAVPGEVISADGRYVAFRSEFKLIPQDTNGKNDVYVYDTATQSLSLASINTGGTNGGNGDSGFTTGSGGHHGGLAFSADGQSLLFRSLATDLTAGVTSPQGNLYLRNLTTGVTKLLTPDQAGTNGANADLVNIPVLSADGRYIAFTSAANNLVAGDFNNGSDVFLRDLEADHPVLASLHSRLLSDATTSRLGGILGGASADGRYVVFISQVGSQQNDLTPGVPFIGSGGGNWGVFVLDRQTGAYQAVDVDPSGIQRGATNTGNQDQRPIITPDGRYVVFRSLSTNLVPGVTYTAGAVNVFVRDLQTQTTRIVSVDPTGTQNIPVPGDTQFVISNDGRYVAFTSSVLTPFPGIVNVTPGQHYILLRDFGDGVTAPTTMLVSHDLGNTGQVRGDSRDLSMTPDGRYILFRSQDPFLAASDGVLTWDVFRWDRTTNNVDLVSVNRLGTGTGDRNSSAGYAPVMTPDGRYIAFGSDATDLVPPMTVDNARSDIYMRDMGDGVTAPSTQVIARSPGPFLLAHLFAPSISDDGQTIVFRGQGTLFEPPTPPGFWANGNNVYVWKSGDVDFVSWNAAHDDTGNHDSDGLALTTTTANTGPLVSPNGRYVAFTSRATDLVPDFADINGSLYDLYIRDLATHTTKLISYHVSGATGSVMGQLADHGLFTADSLEFLFDSTSFDLWPGDFNGLADPSARDVFVTSTAGFSSIAGRVFSDEDGTGPGTTGAGLPNWSLFLDLNSNGTLDRDEPISMTAGAAGSYVFRNLQPGSYTVTLIPQNGYERSIPAGSGTYSITIASEGTAITGRDFGVFRALPDLEVSAVNVSPGTAVAGQAVTVTWTVTNVGLGNAVDSWQDAIYLSSTPTLSADAQLLKVVSHEGGLIRDGSYNGFAQVAVPPVSGTWYIIVQSDRRRQVTEGEFNTNRANNIASSVGTLDVSIPTLTMGTPLEGALSSTGSNRYFQFSAAPGTSLLVTLNSAAANGQLEVYVRRGALPTVYDFDFVADTLAQPDQLLTIPETQPGTYFVMVRGVSGAALNSAFTLTAAEPGLTLQSLGITQAGNNGLVTIPIHGTNLTAETLVQLVQGAITLDPVAVDLRDPSLLYATFDLTGQPTGTWTLRVGSGGQETPFEVFAGHGPDLQVHMEAPSAMRNNQPGTFVIVHYENTGDTDMPAPVFMMEAKGHPEIGRPWALLQLYHGDMALAKATSDTVQFIGQGSDSPGGVLRAGDKGQVKVRVLQNYGSINGGGPYIEVTLKSLAADTTPILWNDLKEPLQPTNISDEAWEAVYSVFTTSLGGTTAQFQASQTADAAYLKQVGVENASLAQIMGLEMLRADAALPIPTLASMVDVAFPTTGLSLNFGRTFFQSISGRYRLGTLGRGWVSNWDITATTAADGEVRINYAGTPRVFTPDPRRSESFVNALFGDHGTLSTYIAGGGYQLREADGRITRFRTDGKLDYVQDTNGNRITAGYNGSGQLVTLTHSDGSSLTIAYNAQGRISTVTDSASRVATYTYDASSEHLLSVATVDGTMQYSYVTGQGAAREHALAQVTDPAGVEAHYTYDPQGRLTSMFRGTVASPIAPVTIGYVSRGGVTFTDAAGTTTVLYNHAGQPAVVKDALGRTMRALYDDDHNLTHLRLPSGLAYEYRYDTIGNLTRITDPLGQQTNFTYDGPFNALASYTDARGKTTRYGHDAGGNLLSITYANGSQERFTYDPLGNMTESINRRGNPIDYTYNAAGQITQITFADTSHLDYTYDARGNLETATDSSGTTTLEYDAADRLTKVTYPGGRFLQFFYNAGGQRIQSVDHTGFTINYQYDTAGRLSGLTDGGSNPIVTYTYDAAGRLSRKDMGNGTRTTYEYDAAGQLLHLVNLAPNHTTVNSFFDYTYDSLGRVSTQVNADGSWTYTYDFVGQLTHAVFTSNNTGVLPHQDLQYSYDAVGNRTQTIINGVTTNYTVNDLNEYTQVGATTYTYDADGNLQTKTEGSITTTYTFDDLNRLLGVSSPGETFSYGFDALGQFTTTTHNGTTTRYLNDPTGFGNISGLGTITAEFTGAGSLIAHFVNGLGLVSRTDGSSAAYDDFDMLGSTVGMTNGAGNYVNRYSYLPFGETTTLAAALANPFQFVGQFGVRADDSGFQHMGFRAYDAIVGQFVSTDPIGLLGGDINVRRYSANNPINSIDPSGLESTDTGGPSLNLGDLLQASLEGALNFAGQLNNQSSLLFGPEGGTLIHPNRTDADAYKWLEGYMKGNQLGEPPGWAGKLAKPSFASRALPHLAKWGGRFGNVAAAAQIGLKIPRAFQLAEDLGRHNNFFHPPADWANNPIIRFIFLLGPADPNEIIGPAGSGSQNWVSSELPLPYTVLFENDPKVATVAAQDVTITQQLDNDLDWSTFELGNFRFGSIEIIVPDGRQSYATTVMTTNVDGTALRVDISASLDLATGIVTWAFRSLDPLTGLLPENPVAGFLPVNDDTKRGEGAVFYTVRPKADRTSGTEIRAVASIVFDINNPITTNQKDPHDPSKGTDPNKEGLATLDADRPLSSVWPLATLVTTTNFTVSWSGSDPAGGSGLATFDIYVSDNGGAWTLWLDDTTATSATFTGVDLHTYAFKSLAVDVAGLQQTDPGAAQATTQVALPPTAMDDVYGVTAGINLVTTTLNGLLLNDVKVAGRTHTAQLVTGPTKGTLTLNANGSFTYKPGATFNGLDSFTYRIRDNTGRLSNIATVTLATQLVNFRVTTQSINEVAATYTLWVDLRVAPTATTTVDYSVLAQTAVAGLDFNLVNGTLTFNPGQKSKALTFTMLHDTLDEVNEKFLVTLSNPSNGVLGTRRAETVTITDNDAPPIIQFRLASSSGDEGTSTANLEVFLSTASAKTVTINYKALALLFGGTATSGVDFTLANSTLTFNPGETSKLIPLAITNDALDEKNETVKVQINTPLNATLGLKTVHTYTVLDNDPTPTVSFAVAASSVNEAAGTITLTVTLSAASALNITVSFAATGGTAKKSGIDYSMVSVPPLTFTAGQTSKTITLRLTNDALVETDETALLTLSSPVNAVLGTFNTHILTILDDD